MDESYAIACNERLLAFMENTLAQCEAHMVTLSKRQSMTEDQLDRFFRQWIKGGEQDE